MPSRYLLALLASLRPPRASAFFCIREICAMIRDYLIPAIKERFPNVVFSFDEPPKPIASLRSPCEALGGVEISDDGDEATVYLTNATHGHFSCYDDKLTGEQKEQEIASDVVGFLEALLSDRVVVWRVLGGMAGGWRVLADEPVPGPSLLRRQFLWSKEIA
jgi:hypothetical protein